MEHPGHASTFQAHLVSLTPSAAIVRSIHPMQSKLLLFCLLGSTLLACGKAQPPSDPAEIVRQRITAKVESVKQGVQAWAAGGRDPSAMVTTMQETIKPLLDAGKAAEAEAALDRLLEQLTPGGKPAQTDSRPISNAIDRWPGRDGNPAYEPLVPSGETVNQGGLYDPSIEYSLDGKTGWLVYSAIRRGPKYEKQVPVGPYCETHLARTVDGGKTWSFVQALNHSTDDTLQHFDGQKLPGVWRYEVPSIVHDPGDASGEWKLFTHFYFWNLKNDRMPAYGWIALQTASDPAGKWSEPKPLFGSNRFPPKPYALTSVNVNALDPSLKETLVYTEPGAFYRDGTLYLSLTALAKTGPEKIVLLASAGQGSPWKFVSTLVTNEDAKRLGYKRFDGSAIAGQAGRVFFLVSPDSGNPEHAGTMIIEFADLVAGKLQRDESGKLVVYKHLREQPGYPSRGGAGQSCFNEHNDYGGVVMPQVIMKDAPQAFQMFSTRQSLIDVKP
jgi:hypothetical protein